MSSWLGRWWLHLVVLLGLFVQLASVSNLAVRAAGPPPDERVRAPFDFNTTATTLKVEDGNGRLFVITRASSGSFSSSVIVLTIDGSCVLCDLEGAYGTASWQVRRDGYGYLTVVSSNKRDVNTWRLDERYGFTRIRPQFGVSALPQVIVP